MMRVFLIIKVPTFEVYNYIFGIYMKLYAYMKLYKHIHAYVYFWTCVDTHVYIISYIPICMCVYMHIHIHTHM